MTTYALSLRFLPLWLLAILLLAGCQATPPASAIAPNTVSAALPVASPTLAQSLKPAIVYTVAPEPSPTFLPATATTIPTVTAVSPSGTATPDPSTLVDTPTPQPTFTVPALPYTDPSEHYWLRRPIPEGGVVWTDKVYPYGSTRGGALQTHHGVEFYVPSGTIVLSAASGTVRVAGSDSTFAQGPETNFYGNVIVIELDAQLDGQPVYNLYGHLSEIYVNEGQHVDAQQTIALSGASGIAEGPHLHFEVRLGQNSYTTTRNPSLWLYPFPDQGTVAGLVRWPDGSLVREALVTLNRIDATSHYAGTTTYADDNVNADDGWGENFVIDDVEAGYYLLTVQADKKYKAELWVYPFRTSFVEITLGE